MAGQPGDVQMDVTGLPLLVSSMSRVLVFP